MELSGARVAWSQRALTQITFVIVDFYVSTAKASRIPDNPSCVVMDQSRVMIRIAHGYNGLDVLVMVYSLLHDL